MLCSGRLFVAVAPAGRLSLVRSSTNCEEPCLARHVEFGETFDGAIRWNPERPLSPHIALFETAFRAHVENQVRSARSLNLLHLRDAYELFWPICALEDRW